MKLIDLSDDILIMIIMNLDYQDYRVLDCVSRRFTKDCVNHEFVRHKYDWRAGKNNKFPDTILYRAARKFYKLPLIGNFQKNKYPFDKITWVKTAAQAWHWRHWEGEEFPSSCRCGCRFDRQEPLVLKLQNYESLLRNMLNLIPQNSHQCPGPYRRSLKLRMKCCQPYDFTYPPERDLKSGASKYI